MSLARGLIGFTASICTLAFGGVFTYQEIYQSGRSSILGATLLVAAAAAWIILDNRMAKRALSEKMDRMIMAEQLAQLDHQRESTHPVCVDPTPPAGA